MTSSWRILTCMCCLVYRGTRRYRRSTSTTTRPGRTTACPFTPSPSSHLSATRLPQTRITVSQSSSIAGIKTFVILLCHCFISTSTISSIGENLYDLPLIYIKNTWKEVGQNGTKRQKNDVKLPNQPKINEKIT